MAAAEPCFVDANLDGATEHRFPEPRSLPELGEERKCNCGEVLLTSVYEHGASRIRLVIRTLDV